MKGNYHSRMASLCRPDVDAAIYHYRTAGNFYVEAAGKYPEDDENHVCKSTFALVTAFGHYLLPSDFLNCGVQCFFKCGTPLRETLPILKRIRLAMPKMKRIWNASAMSKQGRDKVLARALTLETKLLDAIKKGDFTLDDLAAPKWTDWLH
jgi:stress-induced-phosphoprotein 1